MLHSDAIINQLARVSADEALEAYLDALPPIEQLDARNAIDCETPARPVAPAPAGDSSAWDMPF